MDETRNKVAQSVNDLNLLINELSHLKRFLYLIEEDGCNIYIAYAHPDGKFKYVSTPFAQILEYSKEEIYQMSWTELIHPDDRDKTQEDYIIKLQEDKSFMNYSNRYVSKSGNVINLTWYTSAIHPGTDKLTLCIAINTSEI